MKNLPNYTDNDIDEDMKLTSADYIKIIHHYQGNRDTRKNKKSVKERAHQILAQKLCRCIKSVDDGVKGKKTDEGRRIAYCTKSIFNRKGLRHHGFRCSKTKNGKMTRDVTKTVKRLKIT
jgi:hypothetical protein